jgi:outer membrane lipoprotein-sorting protein
MGIRAANRDAVMKIPLLSLVVARCRAVGMAALIAAAGAAGGVGAPSSGFLQYEQTTTMASPHPAPLKMVDKLWFKGRSFRREDLYARNKMLTVSNAGGTFVLLPGHSGAVQLAAPPPVSPTRASGIPGLMFLDAATIARTAKKVGTEKVGRYTADVYETRTRIPATQGAPPQEQTMRYWVSRDLPVPVQILMKSSPGTQTVSVLQSVQLNIPIPDRMFQLPKGTKVRVVSPPAR